MITYGIGTYAGVMVVITGDISQVPAAAQVATAVRTELATELQHITDVAAIHGLVSGSPLQVTANQRQAGSITQTITEVGGTVTVERTA